MKCPNCNNDIKRFRKFSINDLAEYKCDSCGVLSERKQDYKLFLLSFINVFITMTVFENYKSLGLFVSILIFALWLLVFFYLDNKFGRLEDISKKRYPVNELIQRLRNEE